MHLITVIGIIFSALFHIFVREPNYQQTLQQRQISGESFKDNQSSVYREKVGSCYSINIAEFGSNKNIDKGCSVDNQEKLIVGNVPLEELSGAEKNCNQNMKSNRNQKIWSDWLKSIKFWQICFIYMMSRLFVNLTQVYTPLYLQDSLGLAKVIQKYHIVKANIINIQEFLKILMSTLEYTLQTLFAQIRYLCLQHIFRSILFDYKKLKIFGYL